MPEMPMPTPISAVISGIPAASIEPKVRTRTIAETRMPICSPVPPMACSIFTASPPASTVSPASRACSVAASRASCALSSTSAAGTLYVTTM